MEAPIGLIAGEGTLPVITAQGIAAHGRRVACVGLHHQYGPDLPRHCDRFNTAGVVQFGRWIRLLRGWGVREAVMVGGVRKDRIYKPFFLFHQLPDWRGVRMWFGTLRHDKRTDVMLRAVADTLSVEGIELVDSTQYIPEQMADAGPMTRQRPSGAQQKDIDFALPIIQQIGRLDIGQAITVRECEVIAVEAVEGTDRLIDRTGQLCPRGGWTLVKIAKPTQD
ncbi:MAG: UDP-2,3-diacylglucosamine diphosphatase LpxI, partial [Phycisphaerae bacterium]|nr:UDP-2,3-diacylglucosamine diphosphatase LpxI [Phycisphaerae bacterium]